MLLPLPLDGADEVVACFDIIDDSAPAHKLIRLFFSINEKIVPCSRSCSPHLEDFKRWIDRAGLGLSY